MSARKVFVKFSGQRSKENATVTSIQKAENNELFVEKRAIYQSGYQNLEKIYTNRALLERTYPGCRVCSMELEPENRVGRFEFLNGAAIGDRYVDAAAKKDYKAFFETVQLHKEIFFQNESNLVDFETSEQFEALFGDPTPYLGKKAFRVTDFEATAFNIILDAKTGQPLLFDYECVYDFPIPVDIVLYHCVFRTLYLCMPQLSKFVKRDWFLRQLKLGTEKSVLEATWKEWRQNFSFGEEQEDETVLEEAAVEVVADDADEEEYIPENYLARYRKASFKLESLISKKMSGKVQQLNTFTKFKMKVKKLMPKPIYAALKKMFRPMLKRMGVLQ